MRSKTLEIDGVCVTVFENGTIIANNAIRIPHKNSDGYLCVRVRPSGKIYKVHRLVAMTFISNPDNKPQVNHIDGNKMNNCVNNLEWCSNRENVQHAWATGLCRARYGKNSRHKTPVNQYDINGNFIASYSTMREAAKATGTSENGISDVINKRQITSGGFIWEKQNI